MDFETLAIQSVPIGIALTERRVIRACNPAFADMFGAGVDAFVDLPLVGLYPSAEEYRKIGELGLERLRKNLDYHDQRIMRRLDGRLFWCRVSGRSLTSEEPYARAIWTFSDLSEERPVLDLSPREKEVAIRTCQGHTAKEIARDLALSHRTVEHYRARLFEKSGARNKAEFVAFFSGVPM